MFGYLVPKEDELNQNQKDTLSMYYCSICKYYKKSYNNFCRLFISYDILLPTIIFSSVSENPQKLKQTKCILHPFTSFNIHENEMITYVADINFLLYYYKIYDNLIDTSRVIYKYIYKDIQKLLPNVKYKFLNSIFKKNILDLSKYEKRKGYTPIDNICEPMGNLIGCIFEYMPGKIKNNSLSIRSKLYNLGYNLGKWVYLIDSLDDLKKDIYKDNFNPLVSANMVNTNYYSIKNLNLERISIILNLLLDNCISTLDAMELTNHKDIISNYFNISLKNINTNILNKYKYISNKN